MTVLKAQAPIIRTVIIGADAVLSDYLRRKTDKFLLFLPNGSLIYHFINVPLKSKRVL